MRYVTSAKHVRSLDNDWDDKINNVDRESESDKGDFTTAEPALCIVPCFEKYPPHCC